MDGSVATTRLPLGVGLTFAYVQGVALAGVFFVIPMLHNFKREQHAEIQYTDLFTPQGESIGTKVEVIFTAAKLVEKANDESLK